MRAAALISLSALASACGSEATSVPDQTDAASELDALSPGPPEVDGASCDPGEARLEDGTCAALAPRGCEGVSADGAHECVPRWCWDLDDGRGGACGEGADDFCLPRPRACTADELAAGGGCPAGTWPDPGGTGACIEPGWGEESGEPAPPRWCFDGVDDDGAACAWGIEGCRLEGRACAEGEAGCEVGEWPDPAAGGACVVLEAGPFDTQRYCWGEDPLVVRRCGPEETGCAAGQAPVEGCVDPCAPVDVADARVVDPSDPEAYATLAEALVDVPEGATIVLAPGSHTGTVTLDTALTLRGRCADQVEVDALHIAADVTLIGLRTGALTVAATGSLEGHRLDVRCDDCGGATGVLAEGDLRLVASRVSGWGEAAVQGRVGALALEGTRLEGGLTTVRADGGSLTMVGSHLQGGAGGGVYTEAGTSPVRLEGVTVVDSTDPRECAAGIRTGDDARVELLAVRVWGQLCRAVHLNRVAQAEIAGLSAGGTPAAAIEYGPDEEPTRAAVGGAGVMLRAPGSARIAGVRVQGSLGFGLMVDDSDDALRTQRATLAGIRVHDVQRAAAPSEAGYDRVDGVGLKLGLPIAGSVPVSGVWIDQTNSVGFFLFWTTLDARDLVITDTGNPDEDGGFLGAGVMSTSSGGYLRDLHLRRTRVGVLSRTLFVDPPGRQIFEDVTLADIPRQGFRADFGGQILIRRARARDLGDAALAVFPASTIVAQQMTIERVAPSGMTAGGDLIAVGVRSTDNLPSEDAGGMGATAARYGSLLLAGSYLGGNRTAGALSWLEDATLTAWGVVSEGNLPDTSDRYGVGFAAILDGELNIHASVSRNNHTAGIAVDSAALVVEDTLVDTSLPTLFDDVRTGEQTTFGDGVMAFGAPRVRLTRTWLVRQERAGLLLDSCPDVVLDRLLLADNLFGLVAQAGTTVFEQDIAFAGNERDRCKDAFCIQVPEPPSFAPDD